MISIGFIRFLNSQKEPVSSEIWHLWRVALPRRTITGRLAWGRVWRRRDGRHWIYKQYLSRHHHA
ncbi:hypothetical protein V1291_003476 [Nitrobacteraceae bacterium AZCC 1564]